MDILSRESFLFLYCNLNLLYFSWLFTIAVLRPVEAGAFCVQWSGIYIITIYLLTMVMGMLHLMYISVIIIIISILLMICIAAHVKMRMRFPSTMKTSFTAFSLPGMADHNRSLFQWIAVSFSVFLFVILIMERIVKAIQAPVMHYDALYFYLPTVVSWIHNHGLGVWDSAQITVQYFPCGSYILQFWCMFLTRNDQLIGLIQPLILLLTACTLYQIGKLLSFNKSAWCIMTLSSLSAPLFLYLAGEENNDFIIMYSFILALYFFLCYTKQMRPVFICVSGAAAGICLGSKYAGLGWVALLSVIYFVYSLCDNRSIRKRLHHPVLWVSGVLTTGSYWYIRNLLITGNMTFPSQFTIAGIPLYRVPAQFKSIMDTPQMKDFQAYVSSFKLIDHLYRLNDFSEFIRHIGILYIVIWIALCIIGIYGIRLLIPGRLRLVISAEQISLFSAGLIAGIILLLMPGLAIYIGEIRYAIPLLLIWLVCLGFAVKKSRVVYSVMIVFMINMIFCIFTHYEYPAYVVLPACAVTIIFAILLFKTRSTYKRVNCTVSIFVLFMCLYLIAIKINKHRYDTSEGNKTPDYILSEMWPELSTGWQWIDRNTDNNTIGFVQIPFVYPLLNSRLSNKLILLPTDDQDKFFDFLSEHTVEYVFLQEQYLYDQESHKKKLTNDFSPAHTWLGKKAIPVFQNSRVIIYRCSH